MKNEYVMIKSYLTFEISKQTFAISLDKVVNLIENPSIVNSFNKQSLPSLNVDFDGIHVPIYNLSIFIGKKNSTNLKNGFILIIETNIDSKETLIAIHIDDIPIVSDIDEYLLFPYPTVSEMYPCFIANAIAYIDGKEVTIIDINNIFDLEKLKMKTLQEQFLTW